MKTRLELDLTRVTEPLEGVGFDYGFNGNYLKEVGQYWLKKYDWRRGEKRLNAFEHFKTDLDGIEVHFMHIKPTAAQKKGKKVLPLLLVHGWPGEKWRKPTFAVSECEFSFPPNPRRTILGRL